MQQEKGPPAPTKRKYSKPILKKIVLTGEEAVLANCKSSGQWGDGKTNNGCNVIANCKNPLS